MGICIYFAIIPNRISKEVWRKAYADAMRISDAGQLATSGEGVREGSRFCLLLPASSCKEGWTCTGDFVTGSNMESFFLPRELPEAERKDNGTDVLACYVNEENFDPPQPPLCYLWNSKTQGERAHIWLLAMAIAIHDYFPEAVYLKGDINAGQCIRACAIAKKVLGRDVRLPIQYDYEELLQHIRKMGIQDPSREITLFMDLYRGLETEAYQTFLRAQFSFETIYTYFRGKAGADRVNWTMRNWFHSGGDFPSICRMLVTDPEGPQILPVDFVREVLTAGLHLESKFLYDPSDLNDRLRTEPDDVSMLFTRISALFSGLSNSYIDYYLPREEIQRICAETFGADCDTSAVFAAAEKACWEDKTEQMRRKILEKIHTEGDKAWEDRAVYDCNGLEDMFYWKEGDSVAPALDKMVRDAIRQMKVLPILTESKWTEGGPVERTQFLSNALGWSLAVPAQLLDHVLANIMDDSFIAKYVTLWIIAANDPVTYKFVQVMTMNPELFTYYWQSTDALETPQEP